MYELYAAFSLYKISDQGLVLYVNGFVHELSLTHKGPMVMNETGIETSNEGPPNYLNNQKNKGDSYKVSQFFDYGFFLGIN